MELYFLSLSSAIHLIRIFAQVPCHHHGQGQDNCEDEHSEEFLFCRLTDVGHHWVYGASTASQVVLVVIQGVNRNPSRLLFLKRHKVLDRRHRLSTVALVWRDSYLLIEYLQMELEPIPQRGVAVTDGFLQLKWLLLSSINKSIFGTQLTFLRSYNFTFVNRVSIIRFSELDLLYILLVLLILLLLLRVSLKPL